MPRNPAAFRSLYETAHIQGGLRRSSVAALLPLVHQRASIASRVR